MAGCLWCGVVSCEMEVRYSGCSMSCSLLYNWFWVDCHCLTLHTVEVQHWQEVTIICVTIYIAMHLIMQYIQNAHTTCDQ